MCHRVSDGEINLPLPGRGECAIELAPAKKVKSNPTRHLIGAWRGAGERENRCGKQQRVRKVVDPLNLDRGARVGHLRDEDWPVEEQHKQYDPGTEISGSDPGLLVQQKAGP